MSKTFIIAECGINHNGNIEIAKKLIESAKKAGCDAVKFQKRNINKVYTKEMLDSFRESPWGKTQREQKEGLEFNKIKYDIINAYCKMLDIEWFASPWDLDSFQFLKQYNLKYYKIPSPLLTHKPLLKAVANERIYTFISTGMSTIEEIEDAVKIFEDACCEYELMHCNSAYPMLPCDANLLMIKTLQKKYFKYNYCKGIGYSGHEVGLGISIAAVALGATSIERHITLDRTMYGTDQASSVEPSGLNRLVQHIREIEIALGDGIKKVTEQEEKIKIKLRRDNDIIT